MEGKQPIFTQITGNFPRYSITMGQVRCLVMVLMALLESFTDPAGTGDSFNP